MKRIKTRVKVSNLANPLCITVGTYWRMRKFGGDEVHDVVNAYEEIIKN